MKYEPINFVWVENLFKYCKLKSEIEHIHDVIEIEEGNHGKCYSKSFFLRCEVPERGVRQTLLNNHKHIGFRLRNIGQDP